MAADNASAGSGSRSAVRRTNERHVLEALRASGPTSQAELARTVGLSRSAVNGIVRALEGDGLVEVLPGATARETRVVLRRPRGAVLAVDLGHQRLHGSLISFDDELRLDEVVDLGRDHDGNTDAARVAELVEGLIARSGLARERFRRVYVGLHAPYDSLSRTISSSGILTGWAGLDVESLLEERLGLPVTVDNDANFAALAEWTWGSARAASVMLYVKSSNGIGSGLVLDGKVFRGANGMAGELGHVVVDDRGALCNCGSRGCLSAVASGRALLADLAAAGAPRASLAEVISDAQSGDLACRRLLNEAGRYLGIALSHAVKLIAPSAIVVGGELGAAGQLVFESARAELQSSTLQATSGHPRLEQGLRRADMCILGCVASALEEQWMGLAELPGWLLTPSGHRVREGGA